MLHGRVREGHGDVQLSHPAKGHGFDRDFGRPRGNRRFGDDHRREAQLVIAREIEERFHLVRERVHRDEAEEAGVALVGVEHLHGQAQRGQGPHPADAEQDLLAQPVLDVAAVAGSPEHAALLGLPVVGPEYPDPANLVAAVGDLSAEPEPLVPLYLRRPDAKTLAERGLAR